MEELGIKPDRSIVKMVGEVFLKLDMHDKYDKLHMKYPPPNWEYRYFKGKRVKVSVKRLDAIEAEREIRSKRFTEAETEQSTAADGEAEAQLVLQQWTAVSNVEDDRACQ